jgi:hypothetical protein
MTTFTIPGGNNKLRYPDQLIVNITALNASQGHQLIVLKKPLLVPE